MGRMKPAWYYERQAQEKNARDTYFRNRIPPIDTTVQSRPSTELFYHSLLLRNGTDPLIFSVNATNAALAKVTAAQAGLSTALLATEVSRPIRGSGVKPSRAHWYLGDATPTGQRTPWNTRWIRYYSSASNQSHYSVPFSRATGAFTPDDLRDAFNTIFGGANRNTLLGAENGRAHLTFEQAPVAFST